MRASKNLMQSTGVGKMEADELLRMSQTVARVFAKLGRSYSFKNVEDTRKFISDKAAHGNKDRLGRMLSGSPRVNPNAKSMWQSYRQAKEELRQFGSANGMHGTGLGQDQMLTKCLEALHSTHELRENAERVAEGRRAYESLMSSEGLANQAGW